MRSVFVLVAVVVTLSVAGCSSPAQATQEDCVDTYTAQGKDPSIAAQVCLNIFTAADFDQEQANRLYLDQAR